MQIQAAFADPAKEAAEVLGVDPNASEEKARLTLPAPPTMPHHNHASPRPPRLTTTTPRPPRLASPAARHPRV